EFTIAVGLYYQRARFYDPSTGRFLEEDPKGFGAGDPNLVRYVHNMPTGATDPTGTELFTTNPKATKQLLDLITAELRRRGENPDWISADHAIVGDSSNQALIEFDDNAIQAIKKLIADPGGLEARIVQTLKAAVTPQDYRIIRTSWWGLQDTF